MICDALSNAAFCVSLRGPGAELEGVLNNHPPDGGKYSQPIRARVKVILVVIIYSITN